MQWGIHSRYATWRISLIHYYSSKHIWLWFHLCPRALLYLCVIFVEYGKCLNVVGTPRPAYFGLELFPYASISPYLSLWCNFFSRRSSMPPRPTHSSSGPSVARSRPSLPLSQTRRESAPVRAASSDIDDLDISGPEAEYMADQLLDAMGLKPASDGSVRSECTKLSPILWWPWLRFLTIVTCTVRHVCKDHPENDEKCSWVTDAGIGVVHINPGEICDKREVFKPLQVVFTMGSMTELKLC